MINTCEERRADLLKVIKASHNLEMTSWQDTNWRCAKGSGLRAVCTIEDLHKCGNTACIGGYLAISPMFIANGGSRQFSGSAAFEGEEGSPAVAKYLGISPFVMGVVILGRGVDDWGSWETPQAVQALELLYSHINSGDHLLVLINKLNSI